MATKQPTPKPQALATPPATTTEAPKPLGSAVTNEVATADKTAATETKSIDSNLYGEALLKAHEWLDGKSIRYQPISILYLSGDHSGQFVDLGYNVSGHKEDQSFGWQPIDSRGVRSALEFHNISPRTLDFSVTFWSDNFDIRYLVEALAHMGQITGRDRTPPSLQIKLGHAVTDPWRCTKITPEYSNPLPGDAGYKMGVASLSFILEGGANTKHSTGKPLSATHLSDIARSTSEAEKARTGELVRVSSLLTNCVSPQGIEAINNLIENNQLNDPAAIAQLDDDALSNLAISGSLSTEVLQDETVRTRLSQAIAVGISRGEPGGNPSQFEQLASSLQTGEPMGISGDILTPDASGSTTFSRMVADYQLILEAVQGQNLGVDSPIFDRNGNPTAGNRLGNFASCGLSLAGAGGISGNVQPPATSQDAVEQASKLDNLNKFLSESPSHEQTLIRLGLPPDTDREFTKCLVGGRPFSKQSELEDECQRCSGGRISGRSIWTSFN